jgi:hypothetical protein
VQEHAAKVVEGAVVVAWARAHTHSSCSMNGVLCFKDSLSLSNLAQAHDQ